MEKPIVLICFDLNKTLIHENSWLELNQAMGMSKEEDDSLFNEYNRGCLSYVDWQKKLEDIYLTRGKASKKNILKVLYNYTYKDGAKEIINYLRNRGYTISLLSGSVDILVEKVGRELDISLYHANNRFIFDANDSLTKIECLENDVSAKANQFKADCRSLEIELTQAVCIGDGDNDTELFRLSRHGITFKGSKIEKEAWKVIDNLTDIKSIL